MRDGIVGGMVADPGVAEGVAQGFGLALYRAAYGVFTFRRHCWKFFAEFTYAVPKAKATRSATDAIRIKRRCCGQRAVSARVETATMALFAIDEASTWSETWRLIWWPVPLETGRSWGRPDTV